MRRQTKGKGMLRCQVLLHGHQSMREHGSRQGHSSHQRKYNPVMILSSEVSEPSKDIIGTQ